MRRLFSREIGSLWLLQAWGGRESLERGAGNLPGAIGITPFHDVSRSVSDYVNSCDSTNSGSGGPGFRRDARRLIWHTM